MQLQTTQVCIPPGFIDLGLGNPPLTLLPLNLLGQSAQACFERGDTSPLQYGAEAGDGYFRLALAQFLSRAYGFHVPTENLFVTAGASSSLDLLCTLYARPGDTIFVEEPSYFLALRIFEDHGLYLVSIQTDDAGLVIEDLERKLQRFQPKMLYIIPTYQNPSGQTLPAERREQLAAISREHNLLVVADEVYHFLNYEGQPPEPLARWVQEAPIVSVNSFSKVLAPGLRLGWIQASEAIVQRLSGCGLLDSGGGMNPFMSAIVRRLLEDGGLEANIQRLKSVYRARLTAAETSLRKHLPQATYRHPCGGYFFWVRLPGIDTSKLREKAKTYKVDIRDGVRFSSQNGLKEFFRLCFVYYDSDELDEGLRRLGECVHSIL